MYVIETVFPVERPGYYEHLVQRRDKADISACKCCVTLRTNH